MLGLLGLPPIVKLIIVLALLSYMVYRLIAFGIQPLTLLITVIAGLSLIRLLFVMVRSARTVRDE